MSSLQADASQQNLPGSKRKSVHAIPLLSEEEIGELAKRFSEAIPEDELSVSIVWMLRLQVWLIRSW